MSKHAWKGSCSRNPYALIYAPRLDQWVRVISLSRKEMVIVSLDNEVLCPQAEGR